MLAAAFLMAACVNQKQTSSVDESNDVTLVLGSYCSADDEGIRIYKLNQETGDCTYMTGFKGQANPSFVWLAPDGQHFYAVGEESDAITSSANAYLYDKEQNNITQLCSLSNKGAAACNIILSPDGRSVFTSSYFSGSITEFQVQSDGTLGDGFVIPFEGKSVHPERQTHPYLHAVNFTPDGKYLLGNDLGTDRIHVFVLRDRTASDTLPLLQDAATGLPLHESYNVQVDAGAGPRHLCWAPDGRHAYLLSELSGQLFVLRYAEERLSVVQTLQADTLNAGGSADVHVSPDGRFLYASHRLQGDGISIWRINADDGLLTRVGFQPTGIHPRNFGITPNGRLLLCACRDSHEVQMFRRDAETGLLTPTDKNIEMPSPTCVQFWNE